VADNPSCQFRPGHQHSIQAKNGSLYDRALVNPRLTIASPRFGFAWRAIDKTVVRGAYGISWSTSTVGR